MHIYIVIQRQICFVLSELFSVARQARFPKLGWKPGWLKIHSATRKLAQVKDNVNGYVSQLFLFNIYPPNGYWELDSHEEPCITLMATHLLPLLESSTLQG